MTCIEHRRQLEYIRRRIIGRDCEPVAEGGSHERDAIAKRDYSLIGRDAQAAVENGLAAAEWYHTDIPRKQMKELMQRSDGPAIRDTAIWLGRMIVLRRPAASSSGAPGGACRSSSSTACSTARPSDSRWHECGHGTAFKTRWMNDAVYQIACFMIMRNPVTWRWSHTRHHTDTIIVGRDPEIAVMRPPDLLRVVAQLLRHPRRLARDDRHGAQRGRHHQRRGEDLHPRDGAAARRSASPASGWRSMPRRSRWRSTWARSCR